MLLLRAPQEGKRRKVVGARRAAELAKAMREQPSMLVGNQRICVPPRMLHAALVSQYECLQGAGASYACA